MKARKLLAGVLSAAAMLGTMAFTAFAEEYTVSTNDELQAAVKSLQSGDTIKLGTGTYESIDILKDNITIVGADENTVVTVSKVAQAFIGVNANNLTLKNIEFVVPEDVTVAPKYSWTGGFVAVIGYWSSTFDVGTQADSRVITNCKFTNNSESIVNAILAGRKFDITGCVFDNFDRGIVAMEDNNALQSSKIEGNTFIKCDQPLNAYWGGAADAGEGITFKNNVIESAKKTGIAYVTIFDYNSGTGIKDVEISGNTYNVDSTIDLVNVITSAISAEENEPVIIDYSTNEKALAKTTAGDKFYIGYDPNTDENVEYTRVDDVTYTGNDGSSYTKQEDAVWGTMIDAGYYEKDGEKLGVMRFSFNVTPDAGFGKIAKAGIKYISSDDGDVGTAEGVEDSISDNAFYGDINEIPETKSGKYYAKAYIVNGDGATIWSQLIDCAVNWTQKFTAYPGGEN